MLKVLKVYRYRTSGKLIASGLGNGYVFPLNTDLTFSANAPHRVRRDTELDDTPYRLEVEVGTQGKENTYRIVRRWNEEHLPQESSDPNAPLEHRIDVSPSEELGQAESAYVGRSPGHPIGFALLVGSFFLVLFAPALGWWPSLTALVAGAFVIWLTKTPGDPSKIQEVRNAKERLRHETERSLSEAMLNVHAWTALDGVGFERAVARIYAEQGFNVEFTPRSNDQGVDLILKRDGRISIVQCKAYTGNVGVSAIRELVGVRASWPHAEHTILATLFDFSSAAKAFAKEHNITLFSVAKDYLKSDYRPGR